MITTAMHPETMLRRPPRVPITTGAIAAGANEQTAVHLTSSTTDRLTL